MKTVHVVSMVICAGLLSLASCDSSKKMMDDQTSESKTMMDQKKP